MGIGGSLHKSRGWRGQFERMNRWYRCIDDLSHGRGYANGAFEDTDLLIAFFQNCHHLRDWLLNDGAVPQRDLDDFYQAHTEMRICQDICNGTKHYTFREPRVVNRGGMTKVIPGGAKVDANFSMGREYVPQNWPTDRSRKWFIVAGPEKYDLLELADRCLRLWNSFLRDHHLN